MVKNYKFLSRIIPYFIIKKIFKFHLILPFYHIVSDVDIPHVKYLYKIKNIIEFKNDIDFLLKHYVPISINDLYDSIYNSKSLPSRAFHLTFDDGFKEIHEIIAPILLEKGIPATFFLNTDFIDNKNLFYRCKASILLEKINNFNYSKDLEDEIKEYLIENNAFFEDIRKSISRINYNNKILLDKIALILDINLDNYLKKQKPYLTSEQIKELLKNGFSIGAHSIDHPMYANIPFQEQIRQTETSINILKQKFKLTYNLFAFPFNDRGIEKKFFNEIKGLVDISFGTGEFSDPDCYTHFTRIPMEIPILSTHNIIKMFALKNLRYFK
ncbi:MAG: polysaccharide deacetylase family protein [Candidatus Jordarchaeum sp.]|uniref:polysaccharide deacetylase family protein n=1 Tax=Candidatus Jordarchaeum sp. TaxID=2823881 RepID=UPI00404B12D6